MISWTDVPEESFPEKKSAGHRVALPLLDYSEDNSDVLRLPSKMVNCRNEILASCPNWRK
jgi:hypothetical protein